MIIMAIPCDGKVHREVKTAEPIEMSFGKWTRMGPKEYLLDGSPDPMWRDNF